MQQFIVRGKMGQEIHSEDKKCYLFPHLRLYSDDEDGTEREKSKGKKIIGLEHERNNSHVFLENGVKQNFEEIKKAVREIEPLVSQGIYPVVKVHTGKVFVHLIQYPAAERRVSDQAEANRYQACQKYCFILLFGEEKNQKYEGERLYRTSSAKAYSTETEAAGLIKINKKVKQRE